MTKPSETLWEIEPHTKAKHDILRRYLRAWFPILGSKIPKIVYIDGFCGPGKYSGGEDGSPVIAVKEAINQPVLVNSNVNFLFIDDRPDRIQHLQSELSSLQIPANFHITPVINEFENTITKLLDDIDQSGGQLAPTFAFVDPFGFKGAPFGLIQRLLKNQRTEVFINIMVNFINRFAENPSPTIQQHIKDLLGASDAEISAVVGSQDRVVAFQQLYQEKLLKHAKFVRFFAMYDSQDRIIYYLFFASNHPKGHVKIKEAFWKVDSQSGFRFSDKTNPDQLVLFELDPSIDLADHLKNQYNGTTQLAESVITYVEDKTAYISSHARKALIQLEMTKKITVDSMKSNGKKRIKSTFPNEAIIHF